jgi:sterol desaturase/sphingolipid hydroxylase (fatty acid hydroxylase superfamily)
MIRAVKSFLRFDYRFLDNSAGRYFIIGIPLIMLIFGVFDLMFDTAAGVFNQILKWTDGTEINPAGISSVWLIALLAVLFFYIVGIAVWSYRKSVKEHGELKVIQVFWPHFLSNVVAIITTFLLFSAAGLIWLSLGFTFSDGEKFISSIGTMLTDFMKDRIPTVFYIPYPFALFAGAIIGGLPGYFTHWLSHKSRLLWYVSHRCHHTAEIMHPAGIGPFSFLPEIFTAIPGALLTAAASKLFWYEPMIWEAFLLSVVNVFTEKFNHSSGLYAFAYKNPVVRSISSYFGNGVYHYMHHTSKKGQEIVNVGGGPFLIWDRIFGTYRTPEKHRPKVGLTGNPEIVLNPFSIVFSGWQTILWELKHNPSFIVRFKIIFGSVNYKPPQTREFLILST